MQQDQQNDDEQEQQRRHIVHGDTLIKKTVLARIVERFRFLIPESRLHEPLSLRSLRWMLGLDVCSRVHRKRSRALRRGSQAPELFTNASFGEEPLLSAAASPARRAHSVFSARAASSGDDSDTTVLAEHIDSLALRLWDLVKDIPSPMPTFAELLECDNPGFPLTTQDQRRALQRLASRPLVSRQLAAQALGISAEEMDSDPILLCIFGPVLQEMPGFAFSSIVASLGEHPIVATSVQHCAEVLTSAKQNMSMLLPVFVVFVLALIVVPTFDLDSSYRSGFVASFPASDDLPNGCFGAPTTSQRCVFLKLNFEDDLTTIADLANYFRTMLISQIWPADGTTRASNSLYYNHVLVGGLLLKSSPLIDAVIPAVESKLPSTVIARQHQQQQQQTNSSNSTTSPTTNAKRRVQTRGNTCPLRHCDTLNLSSPQYEYRIAASFACHAFESDVNKSVVVVPFNTTMPEALAIAGQWVPDYCADEDVQLTLQYAIYNPSTATLVWTTISAVVPRAGFVLPRITARTLNLKTATPVFILLLAQAMTFGFVFVMAFLRNLTQSSLASADHVAAAERRGFLHGVTASIASVSDSFFASIRRQRDASASTRACVYNAATEIVRVIVLGFAQHLRGYMTVQILWQTTLSVLIFVAWVMLAAGMPSEDELLNEIVPQAEFVPRIDGYVTLFGRAMDIVSVWMLIFFLAAVQIFENVIGISSIWRLLQRATPDVAGLVTIFFFVELGFCALARALFGVSNAIFSFSSTTTAWLLEAYFGISQFELLTEQAPVFGAIFAFTHLFAVVIVMLNLLVAVVTAHLDEVRAKSLAGFFQLIESDASNFRKGSNSENKPAGTKGENDRYSPASPDKKSNTDSNTDTPGLFSRIIHNVFHFDDEERWFWLRKWLVPWVNALNDAFIFSPSSRRWSDFRRIVAVLWRPATRSLPTPTAMLLKTGIELIQLTQIKLKSKSSNNDSNKDGSDKGEDDSNDNPNMNVPWNTAMRRAMDTYGTSLMPDQVAWTLLERVILGETHFNLLRDCVLARCLLSYDEQRSEAQRIVDLQAAQQRRYAEKAQEAAAAAAMSHAREKFYQKARKKIDSAAEQHQQQNQNDEDEDDDDQKRNGDNATTDPSASSLLGATANALMSTMSGAGSKLSKSVRKLVFANRFKGKSKSQQQQLSNSSAVSLGDLVRFEDENGGGGEKGGISFAASPVSDDSMPASSSNNQQQQPEHHDDLLMMSFARSPILTEEEEQQHSSQQPPHQKQDDNDKDAAAAALLFGVAEDASAVEMKQLEQQQQQQQHSEAATSPMPRQDSNFSVASSSGIGMMPTTSTSTSGGLGISNSNNTSEAIGIAFVNESPKSGTFSSYRISAREYKFLFTQYIIRDVKGSLYMPLTVLLHILLYVILIVPVLEHRESSAWLAENIEAGLRDMQYRTFCDDPACVSGFLHTKTFNDIAYRGDIEQYFEKLLIPTLFADVNNLNFKIPPRFEHEQATNASFPVSFDPFIRRVSPVYVRQVRAATQDCKLPSSAAVRRATNGVDPLREATLRDVTCFTEHGHSVDDIPMPTNGVASLPPEAYRYQDWCVEQDGVTGHFDTYECAGFTAEVHNASQLRFVTSSWLDASSKLVVISARFHASLGSSNDAASNGDASLDPFEQLNKGAQQSTTSAAAVTSGNGSSSSTTNSPSGSNKNANNNNDNSGFFSGSGFSGSGSLFSADLLDAAQNMTMMLSLYVELQPGGGNAVVWAFTSASRQPLFKYAAPGFLAIAFELLVFLSQCVLYIVARYRRGDLVRAAHTRPSIPFAAIAVLFWTLGLAMTSLPLHLKQSRILAGLIVASTWLFLRNVILPLSKIITFRAASLQRILVLSLGAIWVILPYFILIALGFIYAVHIAFGSQVSAVSNLRHATRFVGRGLLFEWDFAALAEKRPYVAVVITVMFFGISLTLATNLLLSLMTESLSAVKADNEAIAAIEAAVDFAPISGRGKLFCDETVAVWLSWHIANDNIIKRLYEKVFGDGDTKLRDSAGNKRRDRRMENQRRQFFVTSAGRFARPAEAIMCLVPSYRFNELAAALDLGSVPEEFLFSISLYLAQQVSWFKKRHRDHFTIDESLESKLSSFAAF